MTPENKAKLLQRLQLDEGCRLKMYQDSLGYWTIGYGHLLDPRRGGRISQNVANLMLEEDTDQTLSQISVYAWFGSQDDVRQAALADMAFNLGLEGLLHFPHFLGFMQKKDYVNAVGELKGTPWHDQVGPRADRIMSMITTGEWPL